MPFIEYHCNSMQFLLAFGTSHEVRVLTFGVPDAKNLAYGTPDANALRCAICQKKWDGTTWMFYKWNNTDKML